MNQIKTKANYKGNSEAKMLMVINYTRVSEITTYHTYNSNESNSKIQGVSVVTRRERVRPD